MHRRCARFLECLPSLQHDPSRPEDVLKVDADEDGVGGDDAADTPRCGDENADDHETEVGGNILYGGIPKSAGATPGIPQ